MPAFCAILSPHSMLSHSLSVPRYTISPHFSEFNRYDFIECDKNGNYYYDDAYLFTVDRNADTQYQSENIWESNLQNLERGTLGNKDDPMALLRYWQLQDKAHYPYARENVEYFQDLLDKQA